MIDLYSFLRNYSDLKGLVFSYLCKYEDNKFILRQLSKSFYYLPLYDTLCVDKQSKSFLTRFFRVNRIHTLRIRDHNKNLYKIPRDLLSGVKKIVVHSLNTKELYLLCNLFSRFHVTNMKIKYSTCLLPESLLRFHSLQRLDMTITSKNNEDIVFDLIRLNKTTLTKLKIGIYTGKGVDEPKLQNIIETDLRLAHIEIRDDLFTYGMIKPCTKYIRPRISYVPTQVRSLQYIVHLRLKNVSNHDLVTITDNLLVVERLSLWGTLSNFDHVIQKEGHKYEYVVHVYDDHNLSNAYDGTVADVVIRSTRLSFLFMNGFTINGFTGTHLKEMMIEDVCFMKPIYLPHLQILYVENMVMNPENFKMHVFKLPKLRDINLLNCLVNDLFVFNSLKSINIQNSIISLSMEHLIKRHKRLTSTLFYNNQWPPEFEKEKIVRYLQSRRISVHDAEEW